MHEMHSCSRHRYLQASALKSSDIHRLDHPSIESRLCSPQNRCQTSKEVNARMCISARASDMADLECPTGYLDLYLVILTHSSSLEA